MADSSRGSSATSPLNRATDGNGLNGYRSAAESRRARRRRRYRYWPGTHAQITYSKTALWLHTLERMLGWDTLQRILSTYFDRWKFRHPRPEDFFAVANEVSGRDLTWFFDQVHRSSNVFDYGVERFVSERLAVRGLDDGPQPSSGNREAEGTYRTTVVVRRFGEAIFPVTVVTTFADGNSSPRRGMASIDGGSTPTIGPREPRTSSVDPERITAARHQLHEQPAVDRPERSTRPRQVVAEVDGVAAGPDAHMGFLCMSLTRAWADGWRRTLRAPWIIVGLWLLTFLLALPLALTLRGMLADHLGGKPGGARRRRRASTSTGGTSFSPRRRASARRSCPRFSGFAAVVKNISSIADADSLPTVIASAVTAHIVVSVFLLGGVLDRLARDRVDRRPRVLRRLRRLLLSFPAPGPVGGGDLLAVVRPAASAALRHALHRADARGDGRADGVRLSRRFVRAVWRSRSCSSM